MADYDDAFGLALWDDRGAFQSTRAKREAKDIPSLMRGVVWPNDPYEPPPLPEYLHGSVSVSMRLTSSDSPWCSSKQRENRGILKQVPEN